MTVEQYMTPNPITVQPETSLRKALELLQARQIRHLPVVRGKRLVGIITDRDLRQLLPSPLATPEELERFGSDGTRVKVRDVMNRRILSVTPDTRIHRAARLMVEHRIGCLPVLRGSTLVGIITTIDLLRTIAGEDRSHPVPLETRSRQRKVLEDRRAPRGETRTVNR
ncbi:MAG: CBS domain-containing protein [Gemmatimonadetes bacterium]|nr:CBS domain-containing protein [Gemmatimonadota bacterium]